MTEQDMARIADGYRGFAREEAAEASPRYAALARAVAADDEILRVLAGLPTGKRQPNLLFAVLRYLHGRPPEPHQLHGWVCEDAERVRATMLGRATQTNEPARCAALLPLLTGLPGPLALIETGSSAGLCLYPDRYSYEYDGVPVGSPGPVHLTCRTSGSGPRPTRLPEVVARIGIDLNPLDPADPDARAWLRALVWPGPQAADRLARLDAAATVAAQDPPRLLRGDLIERLPDALDLVPVGATAVVFHTAVLPYVPGPARDEFARAVRALPVRWIAQEAPAALPDVAAALPPGEEADGRFLLSLDGRPLAWTAPHGGRIDWLPGAAEAIGR